MPKTRSQGTLEPLIYRPRKGLGIAFAGDFRISAGKLDERPVVTVARTTTPTAPDRLGAVAVEQAYTLPKLRGVGIPRPRKPYAPRRGRRSSTRALRS